MILRIKSRIGQVSVIDLFISVVVFGLIIVSIMLTWNSYNVKINEQIGYNELLIRGFQVSDLLSNYKGNPENWNKLGNNVTVIGLAESEGVISKDKLGNFTNMTYNDIKSKLNIKTYDFYFNLSAVNDGFDEVVIGNKSGDQTIVTRRLVLYEGEKGVLEFALWQ